MSDVRISNLPVTATSAAVDDYAVIDGSTNGTRKILATTFNGGVTDGDKGDITVSSSGAVWTIDTGVTINTPTLSGIVSANGAQINTANALSALSIDVTKGLNTKSISADSTFTFSGTPATANTYFSLFVTNTDTASHALTIPSSYSLAAAATITSCTIPASGKLHLTWRYDGTNYTIYGDPTTAASGTVTSSGSPTSGQFAKFTSATDITGVTATGTGNVVLANTPSLTTPAIGDATGSSLILGTPAFSDSGLAVQGTGNTNSYYQVELINNNSGASASTDISLHRDSSTASTNYIDIGINSSGFTGAGSINRASSGYVYTQNDDLAIGTNANKGLYIFTQGSDRLTISGAGAIAFPGLTTNGVLQTSGGAGAVSVNTTLPTAAPASGNILVGNSGGTAYAAVAMSGHGTLASTGALTVNACTTGISNKTNRFLVNYSTGSQSIAAATRTYITGSNLSITAGDLVVGSILRWRFNITKTAAGTAASTYDIAFGTTGTTSDTARISFTKPAGTAVIDEGWVEIQCVMRALGATGNGNGMFRLNHNLNNTGHATVPTVCLNVTSGNFDTSTVADIGVCLTSGAADAITIQQCVAEALNL